MNKSTKRSIAIGATIIAATAVTSVVQAEEPVVSQPYAETPATTSNIDHPAEVTKEAVDTAKEKANEMAKSVAEQEKVVSVADQKAKEAEATEKTAAETYKKTKEATEKATPENITKAEDTIKTKETGVKSAEETVKAAEEGVKSAEKAESESEKAYEEATKQVEDEKAKVALAKEEVKKAEQALNETTLTRAQETVTIVGNKLKDAESVNKAAQDELTRAKDFDASRQIKIDETKSALDKERTEKNVPALEQGLADAKANVEAKEKALAETKAKAGVAQAEVDEAQKALDEANAAYQEKLAKLKIPAVAIKYGTLENVQEGIKLLGDILNRQEKAQKLINYHKDTNKYLASKTKKLENIKRKKILYIRDSQLTVANGKSVNNIMIDMAGGVNVAKDITTGTWSKVTMEQIIKWNPDIIILSNFDKFLPEDIYNNKFEGQDWSKISAVKNKKVFKAPIGIYRWDAPSAETPLMIKWIAKVANPELFNDYNMRKDIKDFYLEFFNYELSDEQLNFILNSKVNKGLNI